MNKALQTRLSLRGRKADQWLRLLLVIGFGVSAGWAYFAYGLTNLVAGTLARLVTFSYVMLVMTAIGYVVTRLVVRSHRGARVGLRWTYALSALFSLLIVLCMPVTPPARPVNAELIIEATGERHASSQGTEVWVEAVEFSDGTTLRTLSDFSEHAGWELRESAFLSYQGQPARMIWRGAASSDVVVRLKQHDWSGVVTIDWNGDRQTLDLYSPSPTTRSLRFAPDLRWSDYTPRDWLTIAAVWVSLAILLSWPVSRLLTRAGRATSAGRWDWIWYGLPSALIWGTYLLAFWPGLMTSDSISQWREIVTGAYTDWIPVTHTLVYWLIAQVWLSPAAVAAVQVAIMAGLVGLCLSWLGKAGAPPWSLWLTSAVIAISPANGVVVVTLWKDVFFSGAMMVFVTSLAMIAITRKAWLKSPWNLAALSLSAVAAALFRHNGLPVVIASLVVLWFVAAGARRPVLLTCGTSLVLIFGIRAAVAPLLVNVESQPGWLWPIVHVLAAQTAAGTPLTASQQGVLDDVRPGSHWPYDCTVIDPTLFDGQFVLTAATAEARDLVEIALATTLDNPEPTLAHFECSTAYLWRINSPAPPEDFLYTGDVLSGPYGKTLAEPYDQPDTLSQVLTTSLVPGLNELVGRWVLWSKRPIHIWAFWRAGAHTLLLIGACFIVVIRRRNRLLWLTLLPLALNTGALAVFGPGQDFRLALPSSLAGLLLTLPLVVLPLEESPDRDG